jgi:diguanylate cyclase (GGDEF)-like protein
MSDQLPSTGPQQVTQQIEALVQLLDDRLSELAAVTETGVDIHESLQKILESLVTSVGCDAGVFYRLQTESGYFEPANIVALVEPAGSISWQALLQPLCRLVEEEPHPHLVPDDPQWVELPQSEAGQLSAMAVPLLSAGRLEGVLAVASQRSMTAFTPGDLRLAGLFARLAVLAIQTGGMQEAIQRLTISDSLTGVWTRRAFFERAELAFRQALRYRRPLSAILIDIDRFKMINEMHGYAVGDQVLGTVARNILSRLRESDLLGRYGGDEFIVLLPETDLEHAHLAAERMRVQIAAAPTETPKGTFFVTISAGVASLESAPIDQLDRLLDLANQAARGAKLSGRNQVTIYSEDTEI